MTNHLTLISNALLSQQHTQLLWQTENNTQTRLWLQCGLSRNTQHLRFLATISGALEVGLLVHAGFLSKTEGQRIWRSGQLGPSGKRHLSVLLRGYYLIAGLVRVGSNKKSWRNTWSIYNRYPPRQFHLDSKTTLDIECLLAYHS